MLPQHGKSVLRITYSFGRIAGILLFVIGLAGLPDDLDKWKSWIDKIISDPRVTELAEKIVQIAEFVNQPYSRGTLAIIGLLVLFWPIKKFWRFRSKLRFIWRKTLSDEVWITHPSATRLIRRSSWGVAREPKEPMFGSLSVLAFIDRNTPYQIKARKFADYCDMVLDGFAKQNVGAVRKTDDGVEYDEGKLRNYLSEAYQTELESEFGAMPHIKL